MATFSRSNFFDTQSLMSSIVNDMVTSGHFTQVFATANHDTIIVQPTALTDPSAVDPADPLNWYLRFSLERTLDVIDASPAPGVISIMNPVPGIQVHWGIPSNFMDSTGVVGTNISMIYQTAKPESVASPRESFKYDTTTQVEMVPSAMIMPQDAISPSDTFSYHLSMAARGICLVVYRDITPETLLDCGVFCIQHPVDCNGNAVYTELAPLFVVTNCLPRWEVTRAYDISDGEVFTTDTIFAGQPLGKNALPTATGNPDPVRNWIRLQQGPQANKWYTSVCRERDNLRPTWPYRADIEGKHTVHRIPITWPVPATTQNGEYVLVFPFGLASTRFSYLEEMDLMAIGKGPAYTSSQEVTINVYGHDRIYKACASNSDTQGDHSIRCFILKSGGGVD